MKILDKWLTNVNGCHPPGPKGGLPGLQTVVPPRNAVLLKYIRNYGKVY